VLLSNNATDKRHDSLIPIPVVIFDVLLKLLFVDDVVVLFFVVLLVVRFIFAWDVIFI